jgi:hypothetical protein
MPYTIPPGIALDIPDLRVTITPQSEYKITIQAVDSYNTVLVQNTTSIVTRNASIFVDFAQSASFATTASFSLTTAGTASAAVFAATASMVTTTLVPGIGLPILTGSVILSGSTVTGVIGETANLDPSIPTSSFLGANVDYRAFRSGSARQGILLATWLGGGSDLISFTDASAASVGDTSDISFSFILTGENAHLRITSTGSGPDTWTVQTFFRLFPKF